MTSVSFLMTPDDRGSCSQPHRGSCLRDRVGSCSLEGFLPQKTPLACYHFHCLLVIKADVEPLPVRIDRSGAGDGTRTRDSLLGRQSVTKSPLNCYKSPLQASLAPTDIFPAPPT